ncbi:MAG: MBL fold metallo-hydrolase [Clostridiales bacterium]|nr:MBL fold metallo-hydrolase [Clostridiales bacterium]
MDIIKIVDERMAHNTYLVIEGEGVILIDAGAHVSKIEEHLKMYSPKPRLEAIMITHAHFDHVMELDNIIAKYGCQAYIFKDGKPMLYNIDQNMSIMSPNPFKIKTKKDVRIFHDGDVFRFGDIEISCYNTPGHSQDSSCFVIGDNMFTGDTIFKVEHGRTDLYSGDRNQLRISLERILNDLSAGCELFLPGHGANFDKDELDYNLKRILGEE